MRELRVAKSAGFCFGVSRSVKMAEEMLAAEANCYSLGELIHNDDVVQHLRSEGLTVADGPEQIPQGASVIIRSHGVSRAEFEAVQSTGATVYDATCPKVKRIHEIVAEASAEGRQPVIIGAADHPEVRAICGWCTSPIVVNDASQLAARIADGTIDCAKPLTVVIQTTQTQEKLLECQKIIKKECTNAKLFDTICGATFTRQTEAAQMARNCDAMVVVGGSHSANSRHLYEICCSACANVQFIENAAQLDTSAFVHADTVGLTAGASVPAWIIKEVKQKMSDEILTQENPMETENFDEMLEASLKPIYNGEKVTGTVVAISATEISVDIGTKYSGFIPTSEFTDDGIKVEDVLHVGDSIEASVVRVNDVLRPQHAGRQILRHLARHIVALDGVDGGVLVGILLLDLLVVRLDQGQDLLVRRVGLAHKRAGIAVCNIVLGNLKCAVGHDLILDQILNFLDGQRAVHGQAVVFHALGDAADLHRRQPFVLRDDVIGLGHGCDDLDDIERRLRAVSFNDLHAGSSLSICARVKKRAGTGFACSTSRAAQS